MQIDLTQIILAVLALIGAVLTRFVVPVLQSKLKVENDTLSENKAALLRLAIDTAVKAAEQLYTSEEGKQKKAYVIGVLESQGFTVDTSAIDATIEAAVLELHNWLNN